MDKVAQTKKNTFDAILNVFAWVSFTIAVILAITVLLSTFSGTENGKAIFGHKLLIVQSDSMSKSEISQNEEIFFSTGDLIIIKEVDDYSTIKVGDVITFVSYNPDSKGKTLSHKVRSIKLSSNGTILGFETYGINTGVSDQAIVDPSTVIGKYVGKSTFLGKLFNFFKTPAGYFTSILTPCVLLIIFFSIKVGKLIAKKEILDKYDKEFTNFRNKLNQLENRESQIIMQTENQTIFVPSENEKQEQATPQLENANTVNQNVVNTQPISQVAQPMMQIPTCNDKALELMAQALSNTIESLTRTIDTLALAVGKPVDTLARSIETLATANAKSTVVEKIVERPSIVEKVIEKPVVQTIVKEIPVQPVNEDKPVEQVVAENIINNPTVENKVETPIEQEVVATAVEQPTETGDMFSKFAQHEKVPFNKKVLSLSNEVKEYFSDIHNELISYKKVNHRISFKGISYRVGRKTLAKMVVRGKTLKLHLALGIEDYPKTVYFQEDMSGVKAYEEVPFTVKIKSARGKNNAVKLVNSLAENNSLVKNEQFKKANVLKELKTSK